MEINQAAQLPEDHVKFSDDEIAIVKTALKTKLFKKEEPREVRTGKFQVMLTELSEKFGVPEVRLEMLDGDEMGSNYDRDANKILAMRYSLVSILCAFGAAVLVNRGVGLEPLAFGLSAFKQAAPRMFEEAKTNGRLEGTLVPYTDGGRIKPQAPEPFDEDGGSIRPDIDPENRPDRGNGRGED
jgi:hypothetical protein